MEYNIRSCKNCVFNSGNHTKSAHILCSRCAGSTTMHMYKNEFEIIVNESSIVHDLNSQIEYLSKVNKIMSDRMTQLGQLGR